jgi:DNA polymerase-3 subunit beta
MIPILENFIFDIKDGMLHITASDLQNTIISQMSVESEEEGSIAVPAKMLADTLKNLSEQPVTFTINPDSYSIEINSDNGRYKLTGENASDFPKIPQLSRADTMDIPSDVLSDAIAYTLFATSNDDMKPSMNGVFFHMQESQANFVSTDSHRLIRYRRNDLGSNFDTSIIVHKKALNLLKNTLPQDKTLVKMEFNASNVVFTFNHIKLISRLIDDRFPDYENVIPLINDNEIEIDRVELLACLKRIVIYANKSTNQVRFRIVGNEMVVSSEDLDFSNEASERLYCNHDGADIEIGFNAKFLIEVLNNLHTNKIMLKLSGPGSAGLVLPAEQSKHEEILMLVMPIMLHNYA